MDIHQTSKLLAQAAAARGENNHPLARELYARLLANTQNQLNDPAIKEMRLATLRDLGELCRLLGDQEAALASYQQYYLEAGTSKDAVEALVLLGTQYNRINQYRQALETFQEALELAQALNYTAGRAKALQETGGAQQYLGRMEESISNLNKALSLFEQLGDGLGLMQTYNWLGIAYMALGAVDKAILSLKEGLPWARQIGKRETTVTLNNLGECYQSLFDMEQALVFHQEGLALARELNLRYSESDVTRNLGFDLWRLGRVEEGLEYLNQALALSQETGNPDVELQTLYSLALVKIEQGETEKAHEFARRLKGLAEAANTRGYMADALHVSGLYHEKQGEMALAQQMWQEALFLAHETSRRMLLWQLHAALARISENPALSQVHYRIAAEVIQQIAYPIQDEGLCEKFLHAPPIRAILREAKRGD